MNTFLKAFAVPTESVCSAWNRLAVLFNTAVNMLVLHLATILFDPNDDNYNTVLVSSDGTGVASSAMPGFVPLPLIFRNETEAMIFVKVTKENAIESGEPIPDFVDYEPRPAGELFPEGTSFNALTEVESYCPACNSGDYDHAIDPAEILRSLEDPDYVYVCPDCGEKYRIIDKDGAKYHCENYENEETPA